MVLRSVLSLLFIMIICCTAIAQTAAPGDYICGKWMSSDKNLEVEVYKENGEFKAKIIWFKADDNSKRMEEWTDTHNPDKNLRRRKLLGMNVVNNLIYQPKSNSWEHGTIYDAKGGHYWDASASLSKDGVLKVNGYWHFKFIGRSLTFYRSG